MVNSMGLCKYSVSHLTFKMTVLWWLLCINNMTVSDALSDFLFSPYLLDSIVYFLFVYLLFISMVT